MTTPEDAVLACWQEHREQIRQSENQRAVLIKYVLAIAAAISGLVVQQGFKLRTLPLSVLIVVIGPSGGRLWARLPRHCRRPEQPLPDPASPGAGGGGAGVTASAVEAWPCSFVRAFT